jgi:uncharacterized protein (TIGR03085 family)
MRWIDAEKPALVETLRHADPEAPTLCEGWTARHLLAHLVQREQDQLANLGDMIVRRPPGQEKYLGRLVDAARTPEGYDALVTRFAEGPRRWSAMNWAAETINLTEYVIHHEDLRRGGEIAAEPRVLPEKEQRSIWKRLRPITRFAYRRAPVGVSLATPVGDSQVVHKGEPAVVLTGEPVELLLYVSGRRDAAQVEISGSPDAVVEFEGWVEKT